MLSQQELESWLWGAANILRNKTAGQDYKTYILSLLFFKRLCDQHDSEADANLRKIQEDTGSFLSEPQIEVLRRSTSLHRFIIPEHCHWRDVLAASDSIGQALDRATRGDGKCLGLAGANAELRGVFTISWNQPAPDGDGTLISNAVLHALVQHFNSKDISNRNVQPDILGRAYEYLIKMFADDAGAKAGEFFTPPEVVDTLVRILEPRPGESVYDPTCGSGGMLIHAGDYLTEQGHRANQLRYYGQEMNWQTYAIAKINMILHDLEGRIEGGKSTLTDPQHLAEPAHDRLAQFDIVMANFPFSDAAWWLPEEKRTEEEIAKAKKKKDKAAMGGRFGEFKQFGATPPASCGDWAFIQHIVAALADQGRAGVVCPQGVLFRGQPEIEEETGEFKEDGTPVIRRRKADDEYLIRSGLLERRWVDAIVALPLNIFYGAGVPACLLILRKQRPADRRDRLLMVYAARQGHYRELSAQNQLRPQDVMRILVHVHAYGDAARAGRLVDEHAKRLHAQLTRAEQEELSRVTTEYADTAKKAEALEFDLLRARDAFERDAAEKKKKEAAIARLEKQLAGPRQKLAERDERLAETRKRFEEDRSAVTATGAELRALYADQVELAKHARVVEWAELEENEFNLNIPRYVDTFEPEEPVDVSVALTELRGADRAAGQSIGALSALLTELSS
jgi:type I restriction enzyme M protein